MFSLLCNFTFYKMKAVSGIINGQRYKSFLFSNSVLNVIIIFQNALIKNFTKVNIERSRQNIQLVNLLEKEGFIEKWSISPESAQVKHKTNLPLCVYFKYYKDGSRALTEILKVSPGARKGFSKLFPVSTDTWIFCSSIANIAICVASRK